MILGAFGGTITANYEWNRYFKMLSDENHDNASGFAWQQAENAYFHQSPAIAEWELTKLLARSDGPRRVIPETETEKDFRLFLIHARLGKVQ